MAVNFDIQKNITKVWLRFGTMFVVSRLMSGLDLNNRDWRLSCVYVMLGFTLVDVLIDVAKLPNPGMGGEITKKLANRVLRTSGMMAISQTLGGSKLDNEWLMQTIYTTLGFCAYDVLIENDSIDKMINSLCGRGILCNIMKSVLETVVMSSVVQVMSGGSLDDRRFQTKTYATALGFCASDVVVASYKNITAEPKK